MNKTKYILAIGMATLMSTSLAGCNWGGEGGDNSSSSSSSSTASQQTKDPSEALKEVLEANKKDTSPLNMNMTFIYEISHPGLSETSDIQIQMSMTLKKNDDGSVGDCYMQMKTIRNGSSTDAEMIIVDGYCYSPSEKVKIPTEKIPNFNVHGIELDADKISKMDSIELEEDSNGNKIFTVDLKNNLEIFNSIFGYITQSTDSNTAGTVDSFVTKNYFNKDNFNYKTIMDFAWISDSGVTMECTVEATKEKLATEPEINIPEDADSYRLASGT